MFRHILADKMEVVMAKKHDVIIVGMGLASLATAARLWELGVKDIGIYTTAYGGTPLRQSILSCRITRIMIPRNNTTMI